MARANDEDSPPVTTAPRAPLPLLYEDEWFIGVDKPSGLAVHPGACPDPITAMSLVRDALGQWVFPVHRLDRATSGVLLFAKSSESARALHEMFEDGRVDKTYLALVRGVAKDEGVVDHPIPRREGGPRVEAVTTYRRLWRGEHVSLVEAHPRSGRFHQVRRHLKHLSHPLIGDANYGKGALNRQYRELFGLSRLALHARALALTHPMTGEKLVLTADLPADLLEPFRRLGIRVEGLI